MLFYTKERDLSLYDTKKGELAQAQGKKLPFFVGFD